MHFLGLGRHFEEKEDCFGFCGAREGSGEAYGTRGHEGEGCFSGGNHLDTQNAKRKKHMEYISTREEDSGYQFSSEEISEDFSGKTTVCLRTRGGRIFANLLRKWPIWSSGGSDSSM